MPGYRCEVKQAATLVEAVIVDAADLKAAHDKALGDVERNKGIKGLRVASIVETGERIVSDATAWKGARK